MDGLFLMKYQLMFIVFFFATFLYVVEKYSCFVIFVADYEERRVAPLEESSDINNDTLDIFLSSEELSQGQVYVIIVSSPIIKVQFHILLMHH